VRIGEQRYPPSERSDSLHQRPASWQRRSLPLFLAPECV